METIAMTVLIICLLSMTGAITYYLTFGFKKYLKEHNEPERKVTSILDSNDHYYTADSVPNCKFTKTNNGYLIESEYYCFELFNEGIKRVNYEKTT